MKHHFYLDPFDKRMSNEEAQLVFDTFVKIDKTGKVISGVHLLKYENQIARFFMGLLTQVDSISIHFDSNKNIDIYKSCLVSHEFKYLKSQCQTNPDGRINISTYDSCLFWIRCACREIIHSRFIFDDIVVQSFDEFAFAFTTNDLDKKMVLELARRNNLFERNTTMT